MNVPLAGCSIEALTLPHEDPLVHEQLLSAWTTAYPHSSPIEAGLIYQAVTALIEKRRVERIRATLRRQKVRTAILFWERDQEDTVEKWLQQFNFHPPSALLGLTRSAAGCRWAINFYEYLARVLSEQGTWFGEDRICAIQIQGHSACRHELRESETAYMTWLDSLAAQPNPKPEDIDFILDRSAMPAALWEREVPLWPRDAQEARGRLQAIIDRELPKLRSLEETLRVQYEEPARAEAQVMALAAVSKDEMQLLRTEQMYEQSYLRATAALQKARKETAAVRAAAARQRDESTLLGRPVVVTGQMPNEPEKTQVLGETIGCNEALPAAGASYAAVARSRHPGAGATDVPLLATESCARRADLRTPGRRALEPRADPKTGPPVELWPSSRARCRTNLRKRKSLVEMNVGTGSRHASAESSAARFPCRGRQAVSDSSFGGPPRTADCAAPDAFQGAFVGSPLISS